MAFLLNSDERTPEAVAVVGDGGRGKERWPIKAIVAGSTSFPPQVHPEPQDKLSTPFALATHKRAHLPAGHRFFADGDRETVARFIDWTMRRAETAGDGSWFTTLTFRDYVTPYRANKMVRRWLGQLNQALQDTRDCQLKRRSSSTTESLTGGAATTTALLKSILATEWQQRQVIHYHLLLTGHGLDTLPRKRWECRWTAMGGGFARVYDADMKAAPYLAKYLNKRLGGEVDIGGAWQGMKAPESVAVTDVALESRL